MRLLLLTLYYPPLNTIAALRLKAFERHLTQNGHVVDVITRFYDKQQQKGQSMFLGSEAPENFMESYMKENNSVYTNFNKNNAKKTFSKKLPPLIRGLYNYMNVDIFHYGWKKYVMKAFEAEFSRNKYDYIVASYGPPIVMPLARELSEKYDIPYILDFRDSFIDEKDTFYQLAMKKRIQQQQLRNAAGLIFATKGMQDFFFKNAGKQLKKISSCVIYNGVDEADDDPVPDATDKKIVNQFNELKQTHEFLLLHTGTLYSGQNSSFFLRGVELFNKKYNTNGIVVFLGLAENKSANALNYSFVQQLPKVHHSTALYLQRNATALILPVWNGRYTGFSGKTLEYIFSENFIITSPDPQEDLKEFLDISPNVFVPDNVDEFEKIVLDLISNTIIKQNLKNKDKLYRSYWIKKMSLFLEGLK